MPTHMNIEEGSQQALGQLNRQSFDAFELPQAPMDQNYNIGLDQAISGKEASFENLANKVLTRYSVGGNPTSPFTPVA